MVAPLQGVRVVEIASYVAAPAAGTLLADMGAEVIKVEIPGGEVLRHATPRRSGFSGSGFPEAAHFQMDNLGKRSLVLDLGKPEARAALQRVIERSDVVLTNMLPRRLEKYRLDAKTLRTERPELIFAWLTGYGSAGAEADRPAFDYAAFWARTGFMDLMRDQGQDPSWQRAGIGDHSAALALACGVLAALRARDRSGEGQEVEVSLMHTGFYILGNDVAPALVTGETPRRHDRKCAANPLWNHYRTADDRWLFLVMIESDRYWEPLCRALEHPEWLQDDRFDGATARFRHAAALIRLLDETFVQRTLDDWERLLGAHSLIWAPVRTVAEAIEDPQADACEIFRTVDHPTAGSFRTVSAPIRLSGNGPRSTAAAPVLGAESADVLREAGLSEAEIAAALTE